MRRTVSGLAVGLAAVAAASVGNAQTTPASTRRAPSAEESDRDGGPRGTGERVALLITGTSFGFRLGSAFNLAAGINNDDYPVGRWIAPAAIGITLPLLLGVLEPRRPLRRGRVFATIAGGAFGYFTSSAMASWVAGYGYPPAHILTGWASFAGTVSGFAAGYLLGALTDSRASTGLYVSTLTVSGGILGLLSCGVAQCGVDAGLWTTVGTVAGLGTALALHRVLRPTLREMRYTALGGLLGALPMLGVGAAYLARDGRLGPESYQRIAAFGMGGVILGGLSFWVMAHRTAAPLPAPLRNVQASLWPQFDPVTRMVGVALTLQ
jgi:hypothetical protein